MMSGRQLTIKSFTYLFFVVITLFTTLLPKKAQAQICPQDSPLCVSSTMGANQPNCTEQICFNGAIRGEFCCSTIDVVVAKQPCPQERSICTSSMPSSGSCVDQACTNADGAEGTMCCEVKNQVRGTCLPGLNLPSCPKGYNPAASACSAITPVICTPVDSDTGPTPTSIPYRLCAQIPDAESRKQCEACIKPTITNATDSETDGQETPTNIWTAVGCVPTDQGGIIKVVLRIGLSVAGVVVILMVLAAAFQLTTSKGDPKATEEARGKITAAVSGLLFIIFSMVLLQTIGITILQIPGF